MIEEQEAEALTALEKEINSFAEELRAKQQRRRVSLCVIVEKVRDAVLLLWPCASTLVYGSFVTYLMDSASDLDLVVCREVRQ